jgi:hypothetical protein
MLIRIAVYHYMLIAMPLFVRLDPDLEKEFRKVVIDRFGGQKGALEKAAAEAIRAYVKANKER